MCVPGSKCQIAGVLGYRMGQENFMGRLPVGVKWTTWPKVKIYEHIQYVKYAG